MEECVCGGLGCRFGKEDCSRVLDMVAGSQKECYSIHISLPIAQAVQGIIFLPRSHLPIILQKPL